MVFFVIKKQIRHFKSLIYDCTNFHLDWFALALSLETGFGRIIINEYIYNRVKSSNQKY